jgi:hypothetical protein
MAASGRALAHARGPNRIELPGGRVSYKGFAQVQRRCRDQCGKPIAVNAVPGAKPCQAQAGG